MERTKKKIDMDYEKKYKEALERFKTFREKYCTYGELHFGDVIFDKTGEAQKDLDAIFPELAENEDERIRKEIIEFIQWSEDRGMTRHDFHQAKRPSEWIAYLEKQKEQKRSLNFDVISSWLRDHASNYVNGEFNEFHHCVEYDGTINAEKLIADLKVAVDSGTFDVHEQKGQTADNQFPPLEGLDAIKAKYYDKGFKCGFDEGIDSVKPAEWSEEDENNLELVIDCIYKFYPDPIMKYKLKEWLKSLRPSKDCSSCAKNLEGYISGRIDAENKLLEQFGALITPEDELHIKPRWKPSEDEERLINTSISFLKDFADKGYENAVECIDWLKSKLNGNTCKQNE